MPDNDKMLQVLDKFTNILSKCVVWFFGGMSKDNGRILYSIGSGFIVSYLSNKYLVTALHVIDKLKAYTAKCISINNTNVVFNMEGLSDIDNDIVVFKLTDKWFADNNIDNTFIFNMDDIDFSGERLLYFLLGYPSSKNKIYGIAPNSTRDRIVLSITAFKYEDDICKITNIKSPIPFLYDHDKILDSKLQQYTNPPDLHGMSGGPAIELIHTQDEGLQVRLIGIITEWYKNERIVIATESIKIIDLITKLESYD